MIIRPKDWVPDAADLGNPGSISVVNALPGVNSYQPMPSYSALTSALTDYARGAIDVRDRSGNVYQFAGDETKLYEASSTSWTDVSKGGGYTTGIEERWEFALWKNKILATNYDDNPQSMTLGGVAFADMTTALRFKHIAVVGDHVVAAHTYDGTDGLVADRVRWSAFNDETDWTVSPITGADYRDLKVNNINRVYGGEYGVILSYDSTFRMSPEGSPTWFRIDETLPGIGSIAPGASARIGNNIFSLSEHGFVAIENGTGHVPIGSGRVDRFIFRDLDDSYLHRISCVSDPKAGRVFWAYPGAGNTAGEPNHIIVFDVNLNKWSLIEESVQLLWRSGGVGFTLDQLDTVSSSVDALPVSLDSSQWRGDGTLTLAAFNSENKHGFFQGSAMPATFETEEVELHEGHRTRLTSFTPLVDGGTVTANVGTRRRQSDEATYGPELTQTTTGRFTCRSNARFHKFKLNVSGDWNDIIGVEVTNRDARKAEGRG